MITRLTSVTKSTPLNVVFKSPVASSLYKNNEKKNSKRNEPRIYLGSPSKDISSGTKLRSKTLADRSSSVPSNSLYM
jgi:hypothetical protein